GQGATGEGERTATLHQLARSVYRPGLLRKDAAVDAQGGTTLDEDSAQVGEVAREEAVVALAGQRLDASVGGVGQRAPGAGQVRILVAAVVGRRRELNDTVVDQVLGHGEPAEPPTGVARDPEHGPVVEAAHGGQVAVDDDGGVAQVVNRHAVGGPGQRVVTPVEAVIPGHAVTAAVPVNAGGHAAVLERLQL